MCLRSWFDINGTGMIGTICLRLFSASAAPTMESLYISASQQAKEAIVKRPKQIPAGSSREQIRAEAVSISDYSWILDGYSACTCACGEFPITAEQVQVVLARKDSSRSKDQTGPRTTVDKNRSGSGSKPKAKKTKLYLSK